MREACSGDLHRQHSLKGVLAAPLPCGDVSLTPPLKPKCSLLAFTKRRECKTEQTACKTLITGLNDAGVGSIFAEHFLFSWPNSAVIQPH